MNSQPIQEFVQKTKQIDPRKLGRKTFTYIDIASIDRETKQIIGTQLLAVEDAPSRARKLLHSNDVLVSTVRPNLNAVAIVPSGYDGEIGSTGFCVLRARQELLDAHYLYFFTRTSEFISRLTRIATGASYPAVGDDDVLETEIPLPPLPEQRRIAAILARADRLRRLRRTALHLSDSYLQSVFVQMFGDPVTNPMGWDYGVIDDVIAESQYGTSNKSNSEKRGYPVLGMSNITYAGDIDLTSLAYVELSHKEFNNLKLERGDVIFNRTNSTELVGKTAHWNSDIDAVLASYLVKLKLNNRALPDYFVGLLNSRYYKQLFQERCKKAIGQSNISPTLLKEFPVVMPDKTLQKNYSFIVRRYERLRTQQREALRQAEHLFDTLLHRAFRGELGSADARAVEAELASVPAAASAAPTGDFVQLGMGLE